MVLVGVLAFAGMAMADIVHHCPRCGELLVRHAETGSDCSQACAFAAGVNFKCGSHGVAVLKFDTAREEEAPDDVVEDETLVSTRKKYELKYPNHKVCADYVEGRVRVRIFIKRKRRSAPVVASQQLVAMAAPAHVCSIGVGGCGRWYQGKNNSTFSHWRTCNNMMWCHHGVPKYGCASCRGWKAGVDANRVALKGMIGVLGGAALLRPTRVNVSQAQSQGQAQVQGQAQFSGQPGAPAQPQPGAPANPFPPPNTNGNPVNPLPPIPPPGGFQFGSGNSNSGGPANPFN